MKYISLLGSGKVMKNNAFSPWLMFLVLFGFLNSNAYAQYPSAPNAPPVRYQFGAQVGYYFKSYPVATRMDLCTAWMQEMNPPRRQINPHGVIRGFILIA
jgi:uncharacterized membrane protein